MEFVSQIDKRKRYRYNLTLVIEIIHINVTQTNFKTKFIRSADVI